MTISAGLVSLPAIGTDATHTDSTICQDSTSHALYFGSGTAGVCLGTSSARYKQDIRDDASSCKDVLALKPKRFRYKKGWGDDGAREQYGFLAEDVVKVLPDLVGLDKDGKPNSVDIVGLIPVMVHCMQEARL
jgi:hypothetical protein